MASASLAVGVDGLEPSHWQTAFRDALAEQGAGDALPSAAPSARRRPGRDPDTVQLRLPPASALDETVKLLGVVLAALSLAVASAQLVLRLRERSAPPAPATPYVLVCRIEGPKGVRELRLEGGTPPPEAVLRECLAATGTPRSVRARGAPAETAAR